MDVDEVHFIPKVTTTTTTPASASTPASRLPSVLTSLDIPPSYLEELLRPISPPKVTREPSLVQQPQQAAPALQHSVEVKEKDQPAPHPPLREHPRDYNSIEVKGNDYKTVWYQNTSLLNASPPNVSQKLKRLKTNFSEGPEITYSSLEGSGEDEGGETTSRWHFGWWNEEPSDVQQRREETSSGPRFDRTLARKVTVQEGSTAVLACRVVDNSEKAVSWMRHQDLHILSVGNYKYNTDERITVSLDKAREEWKLVIERVTVSDAGMYQCQVATKPVLSFVVNLEVVVPEAEVINGPEVFVHCGSLINLTCVVRHGTRRPVYVYWYYHDEVLDYERRGGVTVITQASDYTISYLLMRNATPADSGTYACTPSNGRRATAAVHVLSGEPQSAPRQSACQAAGPQRAAATLRGTQGEHRAAVQSTAGPRHLAPQLLMLCLAPLLMLQASSEAP
ncbi:protein sidekick-1-like [Eriocheir sinensis]|uniref:protein sidekick-1-like n=1 Tax=Eriocheir sinensis TaxID=95602 RepID=UPI0021C5F006|nr:protein sidekick-1-like [Eriocheir sinensis]